MAGPQVYNDVVAAQIEAITPLLTDFFDMEMGLYERFEKITSKTQSGRAIRMPIELRPGGSLRSVNLDNGSFGVGSAPVFDFTSMSPVDTAFVLAWSLKSRFTTDSDSKSVVDAVQRTIASGIEGAKIHVDKHLQTSGTGILGVVSIAATPVFTLGTGNFGSRLLRFNDPISIFTSAAQTTLRGTGVANVVGIDYQAKTITVDVDPGGMTVGDHVCVGGLTALPPTYVFGLPYHHNNSATGTWLGWNRANYPEVRTPTVAAGGNNLTLEACNTLLAYIDGELGEEVTKTGKFVWYMHPKQHYALIQLMTMISEIELTGGSGGNAEVDLTFNRKKQRTLAGHEIVTSINADPTRVDFIDTKNWLRGVYKELGFQKINGTTVATVPNSTSYNATEISVLLWSQQFAMKNPRRGGYISALAQQI